MRNKKKTLLWQLTADADASPSYLFGTMHVRDRRAFRYETIVHECIDQCEALATEFNLDELATAADPSFSLLPDGMTLDQLMPPRQYDKMRRILKKAVGIDVQTLRRLRPIMVSTLIDNQILTHDHPVALDEHLWQYAKQRGKKCMGIETLEEQRAILRHISLEYQVQSLLWTSRHIRRHRRHLLRLAELYSAGEIYRLYQTARRNAHQLRHLLLYGRNRLMADRIAVIIREQPTVCAVGAGHLAGGKGVLRLLKSKGIAVRPVGLTGPLAGR